jgi:hypothetical protein
MLVVQYEITCENAVNRQIKKVIQDGNISRTHAQMVHVYQGVMYTIYAPIQDNRL